MKPGPPGPENRLGVWSITDQRLLSTGPAFYTPAEQRDSKEGMAAAIKLFESGDTAVTGSAANRVSAPSSCFRPCLCCQDNCPLIRAHGAS